MMSRIKRLVLELLDSHRVMTLATNRADGWPQATMVGYVNDGFLVYCWAARNAQKCANIRRDSRVSAAIGSDAPRPLDIKGLYPPARQPSLRTKAKPLTCFRCAGSGIRNMPLCLHWFCGRGRSSVWRPIHHRGLSCCVLPRRSSPCWIIRKASVTAISSRFRNEIWTCIYRA
jgi:hypothetical protein